MATIKPFRAVRPDKALVARVVTRSYETYTPKARERILAGNPHSFLHIINPWYRNERVNGRAMRFQRVFRKYREFVTGGILRKDRREGLYVYSCSSEGHHCTGLLCATSTGEYRQQLIRKHEDTLRRREALFATYLNIVRFNAEPVLITYPDDQEVTGILGKVKRGKPEFHFRTSEGTTHGLWPVFDAGLIGRLQEAFGRISTLYIADGHHRTASSALHAEIARENNPQHTGREAYNFFMSLLIPESDIRILEFNRKVRDLNGLSIPSFLSRLTSDFAVSHTGKVPQRPSGKHEFGMYLDGRAYTLGLKKERMPATNPLDTLDAQILYHTVLKPVLGITDLRKDKRIGYGYGVQHISRMKKEIDEGSYAVGFTLLPASIEEIKAIADAGLVMPPKSTYIEPKLLSGLVIYEI